MAPSTGTVQNCRGGPPSVEVKCSCESRRVRDIFFVLGVLPCPKHMTTAAIVRTIPIVRQMLLDLFEMFEMDLMCCEVSVCKEFRVPSYSQPEGCWVISVKGHEGSDFQDTEGAVRKLVSHFRGTKSTMLNSGVFTVRVIVSHQFC
ncbi:uncharacterized protein LOC117652574 [Thrips palmi]|uniref:Uncharacterized protein LOC117652574 n=1 Tax=Thrips palmi TaxID=161013 RepID=A0A6P9AC19_THRPL|nr:uncharacterized protein LOC117652574 [Thrips palmi]